MKIKNFLSLIWRWITQNKREFLILAAILLVAGFCRLYKIDRYMTFLGDEGRDVIVVRRLLTQGHPPLIGPGTSIGNMYLGPLYYYMMAVPLLLANFSPVGPAIQIALLGVATVWFVWYVGRLWFGKTAGLIAAGLYAIAPTVIVYSRSSWNPNIMPFFSLLTMFSIWKVWKEHKYNWLVVTGISYAAVLQSHYLGLLLAPSMLIFYILTVRNLKLTGKWKTEGRKFLRKSLFGLLVFAGLMSPLFFFDIRHNWINVKAIYTFFTVRQETVSIKPWNSIPLIPTIFNQINASLIGAKSNIAGVFASIIILAAIIAILYKSTPSYWLLISWLGFGLIGFGLYKQNIYDHYFGFLSAVPFLLIGSFLSTILSDGKVLKLLGIIILGYFIYINLIQNPLKFSPNYQIQRSVDVSKKIISEDGGKPFDFAVVAERNYEDGYTYFLELYGARVLKADTRDPKTIADQLFVVCEMGEKKCDVTHSPKAEVAHFGMSRIDKQWTIDGVIIYKLLHAK